MTAQKGSLVLLKVGDGGSPTESFTAIGGMRATSISHNNHIIDTTNKSSGAWRELLAGTGTRSVSISGSGIFTDSAAEETVRGIAMNNSISNYELTFGNGDKLAGAFQIVSYQRTGIYENVETYALTLTSAGEISFTAS